MSTKDFLPEIEATASRYRLPTGLVAAIVETESHGNPWSIRYEPAFYRRYIAPLTEVARTPPCSEDTERQARATSWGLMQVMGQVAREMGCKNAFLSELCQPEIGLEFGCKKLASLVKQDYAAHGWDGVIAAYNAGSARKLSSGEWVNQDYVDKVNRAWKEEGWK